MGRSCIELQTQGDRFLLDAGVKFKEDGVEFPTNVFDTPELDGLLVTHAHLDHSGALPLFEHKNLLCPIYMTKLTWKITKIMLKDSYKIDRIRHLHPAYDKIDLQKVKNAVKLVNYGRHYRIKSLHAQFFNAGHIPGSASIYLKAEGKHILYTGDIRFHESDLMHAPKLPTEPIDAMIIESTYGNTSLPDRETIIEEFLKKVEQTVKEGGTVLIPVFSVGRAQDILLMLMRKRWDVPIYFDGLCKKVTSQVLMYPDEGINRVDLLQKAYEIMKFVKNPEHRKEIALAPGIIITTSGMMQGGPVMQYLQHMWGNPKNAIYLTGYQCKRTNGRLLLEEHYLYIDGWKTVAKCMVEKFDFSGHSDKEQLHEIVQQIKPKVLIVQHGDNDQAEALGQWAQENFPGMKVYIPNVDDTIEL